MRTVVNPPTLLLKGTLTKPYKPTGKVANTHADTLARSIAESPPHAGASVRVRNLSDRCEGNSMNQKTNKVS